MVIEFDLNILKVKSIELSKKGKLKKITLGLKDHLVSWEAASPLQERTGIIKFVCGPEKAV